VKTSLPDVTQHVTAVMDRLTFTAQHVSQTLLVMRTEHAYVFLTGKAIASVDSSVALVTHDVSDQTHSQTVQDHMHTNVLHA